MHFLPQRRTHETDGDFMRRRAQTTAVLFLLMLASAVSLFGQLEPVWVKVAGLEGGIFLLASAVLGLFLAATPILALVFLLMCVWYGVESVFRTRSRHTPLTDRAILAAGMLVWFAPALALLGGALRAVLTGAIAFSRPQRVYLLEADPIAFWQSVGFMLIVAAALAYPAWHYWKRKLANRATQGF